MFRRMTEYSAMFAVILIVQFIRCSVSTTLEIWLGLLTIFTNSLGPNTRYTIGICTTQDASFSLNSHLFVTVNSQHRMPPAITKTNACTSATSEFMNRSNWIIHIVFEKLKFSLWKSSPDKKKSIDAAINKERRHPIDWFIDRFSMYSKKTVPVNYTRRFYFFYVVVGVYDGVGHMDILLALSYSEGDLRQYVGRN